jgi:hypothetical protein
MKKRHKEKDGTMSQTVNTDHIDAVYANAMNRIFVAAQRLQIVLSQMPEPHAEDVTWGQVGNAKHIAARLEELVASVTKG